MNNISKRLKAISDFVPKNCLSLIDIGCDHGFLDIYLCKNNSIKKIIASDVNKNALNNAKINIKKFNLEDKIDLRLGNGLEVVNDCDNIDTVVIAGMGTNTIIDILKKYNKKISCIIIQSNTQLFELRREMQYLGYKISDEQVVIEKGKYYVIIKFIPGKIKYSYKELYFGPVLLKKNDENFIKYKDMRLRKLSIVLKKLSDKKTDDIKKISEEIKLYE